MKIDFFLVESPLQLLNAYEAICYFKIRKYKIIIRYSKKHKNDEQIKKLLKLLKLNNNIIEYYINANNKTIFDIFKILKLKIFLKIKQKKINRLFVGNLDSNLFKIFYTDFKNIIGLDDGTKTLKIQKQMINNDMCYDLFTMYDIAPIKNQSIFINNFNCIRSLKRNYRKNEILFLGSNLVELNIIKKTYYIKILKRMAQQYKKIIYIPHRGENKDKLKNIETIQNIKIKNIDYPVELYGIFEKVNVKTVISFYSTALYTMMKIYNCEAIAVKFNYEKSRHKDAIDEVYNYYEKYMKVIEL